MPNDQVHEADGADEVYDEFVRTARLGGATSSGHHHHDHVVRLTPAMARRLGREPGTRVLVRVPRRDAVPVVVRTWRDEADLLRALDGVLPHAPRYLAGDGDSAVLGHVEGEPLSRRCPDGKPVGTLEIRALAELLTRTSSVRREALPPLPAHWPANDKDSQGFLRTLAGLADRQIRQPGWAVYGGLFAALGVPEDALARLADRVPAMARRPYGLLHADLHRDNVVVTDHGDPHLVAVDWELATYGDPLHDLAVHLVRTRYPDLQRQEVVDAWVEAMLPVRPAATNGLAKDLRHYLAFERAQSVYSDVVRAARSLQRGPRGAGPDEEGLHRAARAVHTALDLGAGPLGLRTVPSASETEHVLYRWQASWRERSGGSAIVWRRDPRLPEHPVLPDRAVLHALVAEGAAPAGRVFRGTSHLNTVVHVPGVDLPLVVRRRLASVCRREPRFLSEHAVLRAVERSGAKVAAPRALALGSSHPDDQFAVHTYVGPLDSDRPPEHPVRGLLPHEADGLVRQLAELTRVDCGALDPAFSFFDPDAAAGDCGFCPWLVRQLVRMVAELPRPSQQLARSVGLPDATRLQEILAGHRVTPRRPALLHGDLNPWNLVRRPDAFALTIIDWEMAMVGDPLYDLVRHMHLTPTRPEIRERLFRTWETALPAEYTRDWRRDWRVYRRIEIVRSAYVDLDRFVTGTGLDTPNVRRALESYAMTLAAALAALGLRAGPLAGTSLAPAPPRGERPA